MQVKRVLRSPDQINGYYEFGSQYELETLRWIGILSFGYVTLFIVLDYWRAQHYEYVLLFRGLMLALFGYITWFSFQKNLPAGLIHKVSFSLAIVLFVCGYSLDYFASMPNFFLANYICLYLYGFNSALGHPLKFKIWQVLFVLISYLLYVNFFSTHPLFHMSQIWNVLVNSTLSLMMGILIERFRLFGFVQQSELLESGKKIEELNTLKTKLISILSHDLIAPMNSLKGLLKLNINQTITPQEFVTHSKKISQTVDNLVALQTNLLRWSKLQLEGFQPIEATFNVMEIVNEVIASLEIAAGEKNIRIQNDVTPTLLTTDVEVCRMAVRNFLTNAIKFSHPGSSIRVATIDEPDWLTLSVEDHGIGISPEHMKTLFEVRKPIAVGTQMEKGTGIGLTITNDFAHRIGGKISVTSAQGRGSTFSVSFPKRPLS